MILQEKLKNIPIILGSKSPRRKDLLHEMDLNFEVIVKETDESYDPGLRAEEIVLQIALAKLKAFEQQKYVHNLLICADTIVVDKEGKVIGKPVDEKQAKKVLQALSAHEHQVFTAVAFSYGDQQVAFVEKTSVWFNSLSEQEIDYYVHHYQPLDKAGSYGIQEWIGRIGVAQIKGSYENVIGLPTARLHQELKRIFL
ncbi:MAG: Maf family protein [Sphingobacterium sp.]